MDEEARWTLLEQVFQAALALEPADRNEYVRTACGTDEGLVRRVLSLLGHDDSASSATEMWSAAAAPRIGPYEVLSKLGAGGMGEVYLARDRRLDRRVALKFLPPQFAADAERKRRFLHEAKAASALNHPNIVAIHDFGSDGKIDYLVMEYVPGKPLDHVIPPDGLKPQTALHYASQIAEALACAHAAGIIHRDLKPANVIIQESGTAKVLDFGVAKLMARETTVTETRDGAIIGTPAYMSPEQAEGKPVDARSDIFSFGSLLYEMVTGRHAFGRDSAASITAAILRENPRPANEVVEDVPVAVAELIERCLRKIPADRFQTTAEVVSALKTVMATVRPKSSRTRRRAVFAAAAAVLLAIAVMLTWRFGPKLTGDSTESASPVPVPLTSYMGNEWSPSFSPDGNQVAFSWERDEPGPHFGNWDIYLKQIGSDEPVRLTRDPAYEGSPAWSPDGRYIAFLRFLAPGRVGLFLVPPIGGRERKVSEIGADGGIAWFPDCKWLVVVDRPTPDEPPALFLLSLETGEKQRLTSPPQSSFGDYLPAVSPDGQALVFTRYGASWMVSDFYYLDLSKDLQPSGAPKRLTFTNAQAWGSAWTPDGKAIVVSANAVHGPQLWRITLPDATAQTTKLERLAFAGDGAMQPAISRQGRMSYVQRLLDVDVWRLELRGGRPVDKPPSRLISSTRLDHAAHYSPDGSRIAFASSRTASHEIWVCDSDGTNAIQLTFFAGPYYTADPRWSPDGRFIAFSSQKEEKRGVYIIGSEGGQPKRLEIEIEVESFQGWSRDGRWVYFKSNRNGDDQLWKLPRGGGAAIQVVPKGYSGTASESRDGKFIYYLKEDPKRGMIGLWKLSVQSGEEALVLPSIVNDNFAVVTNGIYFVSRAEPLSIQFLNFASGSISIVAKIPREPAYGFDVSPDERSLIYAEYDDRGYDLMLVENFR